MSDSEGVFATQYLKDCSERVAGIEADLLAIKKAVRPLTTTWRVVYARPCARLMEARRFFILRPSAKWRRKWKRR